MQNIFIKRKLKLFIFGQGISNFGNSLTYLAIMFYIYKLTNNTVSLGLFLAVRTIPAIAIGPFIGILVDKNNKKIILIATESIRAVMSILFIFTGSIIYVYILVFIQSIMKVIYDTAKFSIIPNIVEEENILKFNSVFSLVDDAVSIIAPVVGGIIADFLGYDILFFIDFLTFAISIISISYLQITSEVEHIECNEGGRFIKEISSGFRIITKDRAIGNIVICSCFIMLSGGALNTLMLPYVIKIMNGNEITYGTLCSVISFSYIIGSVVVTLLSKRISASSVLLIGCASMTLSIFTISFTKNTLLAYIFWSLNSIGNIFANITFDTLIQTNVSQDSIGKVFSISNMLIQVFNLVSVTFIGGYLGDRFEISTLFLFCSVILLFSTVIASRVKYKINDYFKV